MGGGSGHLCCPKTRLLRRRVARVGKAHFPDPCSPVNDSTASSGGPVRRTPALQEDVGTWPGVAGGVVSNRNMAKVIYKKGSSKVKVEGQECEHLTAMSGHNGGNANMPAGAQIAPSQVKVLVSM